MLGIVATIKVKPGAGPQFETVAKELVAKVRANEPGCKLYALHRAEAPDTYVFLERYADEPPLSLLQRCHVALKGSRGVVMSIARFDASRGTMTWLGVGNVEGVLHHADWSERSGRASLVTRGGIVGGEIPAVQAAVIPVQASDVLVFATDGIGTGFLADVSAREEPQRLADQILARYGKGTDDALVLVAKYLGSQ